MQSVDFSAELTDSGQIAVPPEIAAQVPRGETIQVVLHWGMSDDDALWRVAGRDLFGVAYDIEDSVYEDLIDDSPGRCTHATSPSTTCPATSVSRKFRPWYL